jgi:hypothetical protein
MSRKFHKIRRLCGPSLLVKLARYVSGDMDLIAGPSAEQPEKEFTDENWRDNSEAPQARQPKRRHIGAASAIVDAAFEAPTTPAVRKRLSKPELTLTARVPSANRASPANCFWATFADQERSAPKSARHRLSRSRSPMHGDIANNPHGLRASEHPTVA